MADTSNIITVSLQAGADLLESDNMNICAVFTGLSDVLSTAERYRSYTSARQVELDFGTAHEMTQHANVFFSQEPNPVSAEGRFIAAYHRASSEDVPATAGVLNGGQVDFVNLVSQLQQIADGSFDIDIDGVTVVVDNLDFRTVASIADVVALLDDEVNGISGATVTFDNSLARFVVTSDTTGATSTVTLAVPGAAGTFVGELLAIAAGTGASVIAGAAASVLAPETKVEALAAVKEQVNFKGFDFIAAPVGTEVEDIAAWAQANDVLGYEVYSDPDELNVDPAEKPWLVKLSGYTNYRGQYREDANRKAATAYMGRNHTVNFNAENSAITMNLKDLVGITPEDLTQTVIDKAQTVGLDIFVPFGATSQGLLTSGANDWTDNRYNLIAFIDEVRVAYFNVLKGTSTKVPQTVDGVNLLVEAVEAVCVKYRRARVFAAGTWNGADFFGDRATFLRNVEEQGFYVLAGRLSDQSQVDREARKAPVIQVAVKGAGAIHSGSIIINFEE